MIFISFIVPCYYVEKYLEYCLNSILFCGLSQGEYEIICVNDGSQDATSEILHRMAVSYPQIRVIDLEHNVGFGGARNIALRLAKGKYVWFVDSDDALVSANVLTLLKKVEGNDLDVLAFNFDRLDESHQLLSECRVFPESKVMDGVSFVKNVMGEMLYQNIGYVWRFIYRLDYLKEKELFFPEGVCWEDTVFTPKSMIEAVRIMSSSLVGYQYYFHQSSVCRVMEKQYPGKLIYDYVFHAGVDLLRYARSIKDVELNQGLAEFSRKIYLKDKFVLFLLRTTKKERQLFYKEIDKNKKSVRQMGKEISGIGKFMLMPVLGPLLADGSSWIYKWKKGIRNG